MRRVRNVIKEAALCSPPAGASSSALANNFPSFDSKRHTEQRAQSSQTAPASANCGALQLVINSMHPYSLFRLSAEMRASDAIPAVLHEKVESAEQMRKTLAAYIHQAPAEFTPRRFSFLLAMQIQTK
jgi:hypothetical protein